MTAADSRKTDYRTLGWWGDKTLADLFFENVKACPDREAVVDAPNRADFAFGEPQRLSYAELQAEIERIAATLVESGITRGDIIMVQLPNISEFISLYFAAALIGATISPVAVQYRSHELSGMQGIVGPKAFVCGTRMKGCDHITVARQVMPDGCTLMTFGPDAPQDALDLSAASGNQALLSDYLSANAVSADDHLTICWTSGTTGVPKGVPRSHNHWIAIAPACYESCDLREGDIMLNPFPLINMASIGGITMSWLRIRGSMILHHPFDPQVYLAQITTEKPHFTIAPPAVLNMLLANEELLAKVDLSSLRSIGSGSAPLAPSMVKGFQDRFGIYVANIFGSNEGMSLVSGADFMPDPVDRASYFPASMHVSPYFSKTPQSIVETRLVVNGGDEIIVGDGVVGELQIRGPALFDGYYNAPDQTKSAFTEDGFFKTGDLFEWSNNGRFLKYSGRCKDLIIRGGVNISPEEIDQLLEGHPDIAEACVFSLPDEKMGERIGLGYVPKADEDIPLESISTYLKTKDLAVFKLPEKLFRLDKLPRNVTNKVMRSVVRQMALTLSEGEH